MTTSLELAKELHDVAKKYSVKLPTSKWVWYKHPLRKWVKRFGNVITNKNLGDEYFNAYTTDELLEWLPDEINVGGRDPIMNLKLEKMSQEEYGAYFFIKTGVGKTPANALCKLAIKLIKEGVIK